MIASRTGRRVLNDKHGAMVFPTDLEPTFARPDSTIRYTISAERWKNAFLLALNSGHTLSERERTAFDIYSEAFRSIESPDVKFVLHFAAIEMLLEKSPRPDPVVRHVDQLIEITKETDLPVGEKCSLEGSLKWLRCHSIRSSGRKFVQDRLGVREYGGRQAVRFFLDCYDMRNRLLHGDLPFPSRQEVSTLASPLGEMVGHLIAGPLLDLRV